MVTDPTPQPNPRPFQPRSASSVSRPAAIAAALFIVLALGGGWYWWQSQRGAAVPPPVASGPVEAPAPADPAPSAVAPPAEAPIQHPIEATAPADAAPPLTLDNADPAARDALVALLGSKTVSSLLRTDDFLRRAVATVDNLGRTQAASRLWPVEPAPGRFTVQGTAGSETIDASNAARYNTFVAMVSTVDAKRAAAAYRRFYPLLQRAYQELGYPKAYFNDRVVAVIDEMLATPEPTGPLAVKLTEVKGPLGASAPSAGDRPWTRYEYTDPALEALPAGPKMLLRMGPDHARKLKAQLRAFRAEIARR